MYGKLYLIVLSLLILAHSIVGEIVFTSIGVYQFKKSSSSSDFTLNFYEKDGYKLSLRKPSNSDKIQTSFAQPSMAVSEGFDQRLVLFEKYGSKFQLCRNKAFQVKCGKPLNVGNQEKIISVKSYHGQQFLLLTDNGQISLINSDAGEIQSVIKVSNIAMLHVTATSKVFAISKEGKVYQVDIDNGLMSLRIASTGITSKFVSSGRNALIISDGHQVTAYKMDDFSKIASSSIRDLTIKSSVTKMSVLSQSDYLIFQCQTQLFKVKIDFDNSRFQLENNVDGVFDFAVGHFDDVIIERGNAIGLAMYDAANHFDRIDPNLTIQKRGEEAVDFGTITPKKTNSNHLTSYEWTPPSWVAKADVLVVGGGGAGGTSSNHVPGGGGGGGEVFLKENHPINSDGKTVYSIIVGSGGKYGDTSGLQGYFSKFGEFRVAGGGAGGSNSPGMAGGSGGGGARNRVGGPSVKLIGMGNAGGSSDQNVYKYPGAGGGGGAGSKGFDAISASGANGGQGVSLFAEYYGSGGGGGRRGSWDGVGGINAGKGGIPGQSARDHFGGGGGGVSALNHNRAAESKVGGDGGSGAVILFLKSSDGSKSETLRFHHGAFKGEFGLSDLKEASSQGYFFSDYLPNDEEKEENPDGFPVLAFHHGLYDGSQDALTPQSASEKGLFFADLTKYEFNLGQVTVNTTIKGTTRYLWKPKFKPGEITGTKFIVDILVVGGGGGGGCSKNGHSSYGGAGGGAGGVIFKSNVEIDLSKQSEIEIDVGSGGQGSDGIKFLSGQSGFASKLFSLEAVGGGGGGSRGFNQSGLDGGSGGGGTGNSNAGKGTPGQGNGGGLSIGFAAGGGGGAGIKGGDGGSTDENGGRGRSLKFAFSKIFGENGWFGGGGSPGQKHGSNVIYSGGLGGGGIGDGGNGIPHTGGGGGGGKSVGKSSPLSGSTNGGNGGSGDTEQNAAAALLTNYVAPAASAAVVVVGLALAVTRYQKIQRDAKEVVDPYMAGLKDILDDEDWLYNPEYERKEGEYGDDFI